MLEGVHAGFVLAASVDAYASRRADGAKLLRLCPRSVSNNTFTKRTYTPSPSHETHIRPSRGSQLMAHIGPEDAASLLEQFLHDGELGYGDVAE